MDALGCLLSVADFDTEVWINFLLRAAGFLLPGIGVNDRQ
jgi:uncharacterized membrane protein YqaE (UPF0057 family)